MLWYYVVKINYHRYKQWLFDVFTQMFVEEYFKTHGNLINEIKQKVEADLQILLITLIMPIAMLNLDYLHEAFKNRDFDTVADILFTMSNSEIVELKTNYQQSKR